MLVGESALKTVAGAGGEGRGRRPLWRRLLVAQEAGLIIVIAVIMVILSVLGGTKDKPVRIALPEAAITVDESQDGLVVINTTSAEVLARIDGELDTSADGALVVRMDGKEQRFNVVGVPQVRVDDSSPQVRAQPGFQATTTVIVRERVNKFLEVGNLILLLQSASYVAIMAIGMTAIIVMGGIDLSVGSIYALAGVLGAMALDGLVGGPGAAQSPWYIAIPVGLAVCISVGAAAGAINGAFIVGLKVHPFIITLGSMAAYRGLTLVINGKYNGGTSIGPFPESFTTGFMKAELAALQVNPVPAVIMVLVTLAGMFVLGRTVLGRRAYAIGGNETAAKYAGVPVGRVKILFYMICGGLAGLSASVYLGYLGGFASNAGEGYELNVIAATVIGGASLAGGRGSALGALLGAIIIQLIDNGMIILEIDTTYNKIVMGVAIVVAVVLDQAKSRFGGARRA